MSVVDHAMDRMDATMNAAMAEMKRMDAEQLADSVRAADCLDVSSNTLTNKCMKEIKVSLEPKDGCKRLTLAVPDLIPKEIPLRHNETATLKKSESADIKDIADGCRFGESISVTKVIYTDEPLHASVKPLRDEQKSAAVTETVHVSLSAGTEREFDGMKFVWIPAGEFEMAGDSSSEGRTKKSMIKHRVVIPRGFWMGKYEVTQAEWERVMGSNPSYFQQCGGDCPVEQVSWEDVQIFISKLNGVGSSYRLPSDEEWEYACLGDKKTTYCGGITFDKVGWYEGNSGETTHPAGKKKPNSYGLYDMSGNVWEWTLDDVKGYDLYVSRGGGWDSSLDVIEYLGGISGRNSGGPAGRNYKVGFRLVRMSS
jgi:formylglycine-generating enzyme required for sulfatase activity